MTRRSIGEAKAIGTSIGPTNETLKKLLASAKEKDAVAKAEAVRKCKAALIEEYAYSPYELYKARRFDEKSHPIDGVATYYSILAAAESMGKSVTETVIVAINVLSVLDATTVRELKEYGAQINDLSAEYFRRNDRKNLNTSFTKRTSSD